MGWVAGAWGLRRRSRDKKKDWGEGALLELGEQVDWASGSRGMWPRRIWANGGGRSPGGIGQSRPSGTLFYFLSELEPVLGLGKGLAPWLWRGLWAGTCPTPLSSRCPWEQAPSCLQELDALPFLILSRTLYKGRKQSSRLGASAGEDGQPGREGTGLGGNGDGVAAIFSPGAPCPGPGVQNRRPVS